MGLWKRLMRRLRPEPIRMWPVVPKSGEGAVLLTARGQDCPSGVITVPRALTADEFDVLREDWQKRDVPPGQFAIARGMKWYNWTETTAPR